MRKEINILRRIMPVQLASATPKPMVATAPVSRPTLVTDDTRWVVFNLLVGPGTPGRLYAQQSPYVRQPGDPAYRLLVSDDFGKTWKPFEGGLGPPVLYRSLDGGWNWNPLPIKP